MPENPQFAVPFTLTADGTDVVTVEQGSNLELAQRVDVLVRTPPGWYDGSPDFGLSDQAHLEGGADIQEVERQLARYVPDVQTLVAEDLSRLNAGLAQVDVQIGG